MFWKKKKPKERIIDYKDVKIGAKAYRNCEYIGKIVSMPDGELGIRLEDKKMNMNLVFYNSMCEMVGDVLTINMDGFESD